MNSDASEYEMVTRTVEIQDPHGVHLRVAAALAECVAATACEAFLDGCDLRRPIRVVARGMSCGARVELEIRGPQAEELADRLVKILAGPRRRECHAAQ